MVARQRQGGGRALEQVDPRQVKDTASDLASAASRPLLSLSRVVKCYGEVLAVEGVDLSVRDGEILTILGPSGSGKTTLLKMVAGFELPDRGSVELAGRDITYATPAYRGIGMVFQSYALFPHMQVAENVAFPLEMRRLGRPQIKERVSKALALVGLAGYETRYPRQLSGGQQQRVALARAVVLQRARRCSTSRSARHREAARADAARGQAPGTAARHHRTFVTDDQQEALSCPTGSR